MKAIGIVGSPRKNGNTEIITSHTLEAMNEEGIETELIRLSGLDIRPCDACMACQHEETCPIDDDLLPIYRKMKDTDVITLASPVYCGSATALLKALMERTASIAHRNGRPFEGKVGGPLAVGGRAGHNFTLAQINFWFQIMGFVTPGSTYWNVSFGREQGDVQKDKQGLTTIWNFGKNLAFLAKKLRV